MQDFLQATMEKIEAHPLWASQTEEELDSVSEALERYLLTKIYPR